MLGFALGVSDAAVANAATLGIVPNKTTYTVGETVVVQLVGDSQGASALGIFAILRFDPSVLTAESVASLAATSNAGALSWSESVRGCGSDFCIAMNAVAGAPLPVDQTGSQVWATVTLRAVAPGAVNLALEEGLQLPGYELDFFGLTHVPGVSIQVVPADVPASGNAELALLALLLVTGAAWVLRARARAPR
jgi:hypothetical protein